MGPQLRSGIGRSQGRKDAEGSQSRDVPDVELRRVFGEGTLQAVLGYEKLLGLERDGVVLNTIAISSGNGETYSSLGTTAVANTPRGDFIIERKIPEWRTSYLGQLYFPMYFTGGYAVHGSPSVPAYPASHGCVRVPLSEAQGLYDRNPVGTPVFVHD